MKKSQKKISSIVPLKNFFIILNDIEREVSIIIFPMIRLLK